MPDQDAELELRKRARRRLVGAVALASAAAIVLPMVMEHQPKPTGQDIQIRIPPQDSGSFTSRIPGKPDAAKASEPAAPSAPAAPEAAKKPESATAKAEAAKPEPARAEPSRAEASPASPGPAAPAAKTEAKPDSRIEPKTEPKTEPKPDAKPAPKPDKPKVEEARAKAILEGGNGGGGWVVQLGAFADAANVRKVQARVKAAGYNAYAEELNGPTGRKTRVRAGPFPSKEAAEKARDRLGHSGLSGVVAAK